MQAETKVKNVLLATSAVTAIVGQKVYGGLPQDASRPYIVYTRTDTPETYQTMSHGTTLEKVQLMVTSWADDHETLLDLAVKVKAALKGYRDSDCQGIFFKNESDVIDSQIEPVILGKQQEYHVVI